MKNKKKIQVTPKVKFCQQVYSLFDIHDIHARRQILLQKQTDIQVLII